MKGQWLAAHRTSPLEYSQLIWKGQGVVTHSSSRQGRWLPLAAHLERAIGGRLQRISGMQGMAAHQTSQKGMGLPLKLFPKGRGLLLAAHLESSVSDCSQRISGKQGVAACSTSLRGRRWPFAMHLVRAGGSCSQMGAIKSLPKINFLLCTNFRRRMIYSFHFSHFPLGAKSRRFS